MIRLIFEESDAVLQANTGGPLITKHKSFDIAAEEVEKWLARVDLTDDARKYVTRTFVGIEIPEPTKAPPLRIEDLILLFHDDCGGPIVGSADRLVCAECGTVMELTAAPKVSNDQQ
jgi:hypothetical protein